MPSLVRGDQGDRSSPNCVIRDQTGINTSLPSFDVQFSWVSGTIVQESQVPRTSLTYANIIKLRLNKFDENCRCSCKNRILRIEREEILIHAHTSSLTWEFMSFNR